MVTSPEIAVGITPVVASDAAGGVVNGFDNNLDPEIPGSNHMFVVGVENNFDEDFDSEILIFYQTSLDMSVR